MFLIFVAICSLFKLEGSYSLGIDSKMTPQDLGTEPAVTAEFDSPVLMKSRFDSEEL